MGGAVGADSHDPDERQAEDAARDRTEATPDGRPRALGGPVEREAYEPHWYRTLRAMAEGAGEPGGDADVAAGRDARLEGAADRRPDGAGTDGAAHRAGDEPRQPGQALQALGRDLSAPSPSTRIAAARALGRVDDEAALSLLVTALKDPDPSVREAADEVLAHWRSPGVAARLAGLLGRPDLREQARAVLAKVGVAAPELLVDVLLRASPEVQPEVVGFLDQADGRPRLRQRLRAVDPEERLAALRALVTVGDEGAPDALVGALADPEPGVRVQALRLMATLGDARVVEAVRRCALRDPVPEVAEAARRVLARLGADAPPERAAGA